MNPLDLVNDIKEGIDDNVYSRQEQETDLISKHAIDMKSDSPLAKNIRPIVTLWSLAINTAIWLISLFPDVTVDPTIVLTAGGVLISTIGFYFNSRKVEKVYAKKAGASIQISKLESRQEIRERKRKMRKK